MCLETAQLLCTAKRELDEGSDDLYKTTHKNHPSAVWVRKTSKNYEWTVKLFEALLDEYTHRYNKVHASARLLPLVKNVPKNIDTISLGNSSWRIDVTTKFTQPPTAMPEMYRLTNGRKAPEGVEETVSSIHSYRNYYANGKQNLCKYTNREEPEWLSDYLLPNLLTIGF